MEDSRLKGLHCHFEAYLSVVEVEWPSEFDPCAREDEIEDDLRIEFAAELSVVHCKLFVVHGGVLTKHLRLEELVHARDFEEPDLESFLCTEAGRG